MLRAEKSYSVKVKDLVAIIINCHEVHYRMLKEVIIIDEILCCENVQA
jgi:hypothetical protein